MYGNADDLLAAGEYARAGRRFERESRWEEAILAYSEGKRFDEAARILESMGRFADAGWMLLRLLPSKPTRTIRLGGEEKRAAVRAAMNFARAGSRDLACGLLINAGEGARAAGLLRMAGRHEESVLAMQGRALPNSPWPDGVLFALDRRTGGAAGAAQTPDEPDAADFSFAPQVGEMDSDTFEIEIDDANSEFDMVALRRGEPAGVQESLEGEVAVADPLSDDDGDAFFDFLDVGPVQLDGGATSSSELSSLPDDPDLLSGRFDVGRFVSDPLPGDVDEPSLPSSGFPSEPAFGFRDPEPFEDVYAGPLSIGPGSLLADRYQVQELLGSGATAKVFAAKDLELEEIVALKLFVNSVGSDKEAVARFRREVRLSRDLIHPNIVRIFEFGVRDGLRFITMELLAGEDLAAYTERRGGKLKPREATRMMLQATAGLKAVHEAGVVHRDIKPTNLMVLNDGALVKLMDFGLAKVETEQTISDIGARVGTPRYMSPEQMRGRGEVGPASDLYSLGVVFYEILTGHRTVNTDEGLVSVLMASLGEMPPPPIERNSRIPRDLSDLVMRLLAKDPAERFSSAEKLRRALRASSALKGRR